MYMYMYIDLYFVAREIDLTDGSQTYTLVGVVNGNPKGCRDERDFPDYHTSIGNAEVLQWIKDEVRSTTGRTPTQQSFSTIRPTTGRTPTQQSFSTIRRTTRRTPTQQSFSTIRPTTR